VLSTPPCQRVPHCCCRICSHMRTHVLSTPTSAFELVFIWFICAIWRIHMCDMTHSYVNNKTWVRTRFRKYLYDSYAQYHAFICVTWHTYMSTPTNASGLVFICVYACSSKRRALQSLVSGFLIVVVEYVLVWELTCCQHSQMHSGLYLYASLVQFDAFICVTWLTHMSTPTNAFGLVITCVYTCVSKKRRTYSRLCKV